MTTKRNDLQAIRGIAIGLVLLFHLQPHRFPLGFVGVDIFFVLSGFLMAMILSRGTSGPKMLSEFYLRRFKRIVPVYYATIASVFIGCAFILLQPDKDQLLIDLKWAVSFTSNIQPFFEEKDYWDQITEYRFFVHCWSLGVEIQFYALAPFLIGSLSCLSGQVRTSTISLLIVLSLGFQLISGEKVAYDLLPSRIWQFLLGVLCFKKKTEQTGRDTIEKEKLLEERESDTVVEKPKLPRCTKVDILKEILLIGLILIVLLKSTVLTTKIMRILSCFSIALLIKFPSSHSILSNPVLIYLGDLSYTMYLLHWPVIVAAKYYYSLRELDLINTLLLATVVLVLTVTVHYVIEKPLVTSRTFFGFMVSVLCLVGIFVLEPYYNQCCLKSTTEMKGKINITEAVAWNLHESVKVYYEIPCDPDNVTSAWYNWTAEPQLRCQTYSNGSLKILVMGNSIAYRAFPMIQEVLRGRYKELRLFSRSSSPTLSEKHPEVTAAARIVADRMRPDIIWNIHVETDAYMINPIVNLATDRAFLEFQKNFDYYSQRTKYFIIDLPYYWAQHPICHELALRLQHGNSLDDLKKPKSEVVKQQTHHRTRLLSLNCTKCLYNNVEEYLFEGETYWYYNRENLHGYTKDGRHFTPEFLKRLKPLYERTVDEILKRLL